MKKMLLSFVLMLTAMGAWADEITFSPLQYETLPDMETPRRGHACFATADGDIVVVGGHTTGFYLTATAERLHDGQWESLSVNYAHDGAANITLSDGRVLICGGMGSGYGVGQSTACEIYDPATNSFTATGSLTTARAFCTGVPTGEGDNVLLSGNWYNSDSSFELWDGSTWTAFGEKSPALNNPFMVNAGDGIVYVFGCRTNYGSLVDVAAWKVDTKSQTVEAVAETGLEEYELIHGDYFTVHTVDGSFYLLGVKDNEFHLLNFSTATATVTDMCTLPRTMPGENNAIEYVSGIMVNASRQEAYIVGGYLSNAGNKTLVVVNYNLETGKTTAYYGGDFPGYIHWGAWALQPTTERIIFTGGAVSDNFDEVATAIIVTPYGEGSHEDPKLAKDEEGNYLVSSLADWKVFAELIKSEPVAHIRMTADIDLGDEQIRVGTEELPFEGVFDGNGHTLTVNLIGEYTVAPFAFVKGAIIKRLHVAGSCYATICGAAGIVGNSLENEPATTISECWSSVYLKGGLEGSLQQSLGGIMIEPRCQATIADCLFTGSFDESNTYYCGGFVNWTDAHITFKNCLNLGTYVCESEYDGGTFIREDSDWGGATFDNIYFKNAYGRIQGEQVTDEQLSDGSVAAALQQNREDQVWIQDAELGIPMLAVFVHTDAGIATPEASSSAIVPWYTLDGRRISTPTRGHIYVSNGKKVIVK